MLDSDNTQEGTVTPTKLRFSASNWNIAQKATVHGVNEFFADDDRPYNIITTAVSNDSLYDGFNVTDVSVININDDIPGVTVHPTAHLWTTEYGGTATFTVTLDSKPTSKVTIRLESSNIAEGTVFPKRLTFTPRKWNSVQEVIVTGEDDNEKDGNKTFNILTLPAESNDPKYQGIQADDVSLTNSDDETPGVTINQTAGLITTESGGTATFTIALNTEPADNVTIDLSSSDTTEGKVYPLSVTFTPSNWNSAREVTITGVYEFKADGDQPYTIYIHETVSTDSSYQGLDPIDVSVTNIED
jgi:hypothetical protein